MLSLHEVAEVFGVAVCRAVCRREDTAKLIKDAHEQGRIGNRLFPWSALHTEHHNSICFKCSLLPMSSTLLSSSGWHSLSWRLTPTAGFFGTSCPR